MTMLGEMICPTETFKIVRPVVELVPVDVMDDETWRYEPSVSALPYEHGAQSPHVRLSHLYPHPLTVAAMHTQTFGTHRKVVDRFTARPELGRRCASYTLRWRRNVAAGHGRVARASIRAVVDLSQLASFSIEELAADRTLKGLACSSIRALHVTHSTGSGTTLDEILS